MPNNQSRDKEKRKNRREIIEDQIKPRKIIRKIVQGTEKQELLERIR